VRAHGLPVRHPRHRQHDVHAELPSQAVGHDFEVGLAHARDERLAHFASPLHEERVVLFGEARERAAELIFVGFAFRLDRHRDRRLWKLDRRERHGLVLIRERIAGGRVGQLRDRADVARGQFGRGFLLFAAHDEQLADPLHLAAGGVPHL